MKKTCLRKYLSLYYLLSKAVKEKRHETEIQLYGRRKKINIPNWLFNIEDIFLGIIESEKSYIVEEIIEKAYRQGLDDKSIFVNLPITESGYYRLKRKIEEKIYEMYILRGDVTQEDIMENKLI